jgi:hypothetical protein
MQSLNRVAVSIVGVVALGSCIVACGSPGFPPDGGDHHGHKDAGVGPADSGAGTVDAAPDAPSFPACLPSCIEQALSPCLPELDSCTKETVSVDGSLGFTETTCAAGSDWTHTSVFKPPTSTETITQNGAECYRRVSGAANFMGVARWFDSTGAQVAFGLSQGGSGMTVYCISGTPTSTDIGYPLDPNCKEPLDRCQTTTPGDCP